MKPKTDYMYLPSDRWRITWRDVKKTAITALLTSAATTLQQSFNLNPEVKAPFFKVPDLNTLKIVGAAAAVTFVGELTRRLVTDRVGSARKTIEKAEVKQLKKQQLI